VQCAGNPVPIGVGYLCQYLIKPLLGFIIAKARCPSSQTATVHPSTAAPRCCVAEVSLLCAYRT